MKLTKTNEIVKLDKRYYYYEYGFTSYMRMERPYAVVNLLNWFHIPTFNQFQSIEILYNNNMVYTTDDKGWLMLFKNDEDAMMLKLVS